MKIIARMLEDELYEACNVYGNKIASNMRNSPVKEGQSLVELLLSSLAACGARHSNHAEENGSGKKTTFLNRSPDCCPLKELLNLMMA